MSHSVTVRHNFETGHRLPHLTGKCSSLHGHSWWATWTFTGDQLGPDGTIVEYGALKAELRAWVDTVLDHGLMLGHEDPLLPILAAHGKTFSFHPELELTAGQSWPTVEAVAVLLGRVGDTVLRELRKPERGWSIPLDVRCTQVHVTETHVNAATWQHE